MQNDLLTTVYSQHTLHLQRVGASLGLDSVPYLQAIDQGILDIFHKYRDRKLTPKLEATILKEIDVLSNKELRAYTAALKIDHKEVGKVEGEFAAKTLDGVIETEDFNAVVPSAAQTNVLAVATPIKIGEKNYTSYNSMMRSYYQKYTSEIDGLVRAGFSAGGTVQQIGNEIYSGLRLTTNNTSKNVLTRAKRSAKMLAITGTNHYANQARVAFVDDNDDVLIGYRFLAVLDSRTSQQCRSLDQRVIKKDDPKLRALTPPLHPNCRSALTYEVDGKFKLDDKDTQRASRFSVDGELDPKPVSSDGIYYDKMKQLSAADQNEILGPTLGKAFRKLDDPAEFAKLTIDSLGNPLTIKELKSKDNALSRILNKT